MTAIAATVTVTRGGRAAAGRALSWPERSRLFVSPVRVSSTVMTEAVKFPLEVPVTVTSLGASVSILSVVVIILVMVSVFISVYIALNAVAVITSPVVPAVIAAVIAAIIVIPAFVGMTVSGATGRSTVSEIETNCSNKGKS